MLKVSSEHIIPSLYQHISWCVIHAYRRVGRLCKPDGTDSLPAAPCIVRVYKLMEGFLCSTQQKRHCYFNKDLCHISCKAM